MSNWMGRYALGSWLCALLFASCTWNPVARPAQPKRIFEGPSYVSELIVEDRYAIVRVQQASGSAIRLVRTDNFEWCELPPATFPAGGAVTAPNLRQKDAAVFWLPVVQGEGDQRQLFHVNEKCAMRGPFAPYDPTREQLYPLQLQLDSRQVTVLWDRAGNLTLVDPWTQETRRVADAVSMWAQVDRANPSAEPQALWVVSDGRLEQRALDGSLVLRLGDDVKVFDQTLARDGLRVAFVDHGDLYEAKSPKFERVLIAPGGCKPRYENATLNFALPCEPSQLVRVDLLTGEVKRFPPGVINTFMVGEIELQEVHPSERWVNLPGDVRRKLTPRPERTLSPIDRQNLTALTADKIFGLWTVTTGNFRPLFNGVEELLVYRITRTNELLWLMQHELVRADANDPGTVTLSLFDQRDVSNVLLGNSSMIELERVAERVPAGLGRRVASLGSQSEPVMVTIEDAIKQESDGLYAGTLVVRLLSGALSSPIDVGVSTQQPVVGPLPGVLYGISEGPKSGLWFAAL